MRECKNCIWFDQCGQNDICEDYDPCDMTETEQENIQTYINDLDERHSLYMEQIKEQNA